MEKSATAGSFTEESDARWYDNQTIYKSVNHMG